MMITMLTLASNAERYGVIVPAAESTVKPVPSGLTGAAAFDNSMDSPA